MRKQAVAYAKTKTEINCADDQRLCFRYIDSTIPLHPKSEFLILEPSPVVIEPGLCRKPRREVFSRFGSYGFMSYFR